MLSLYDYNYNYDILRVDNIFSFYNIILLKLKLLLYIITLVIVKIII